MAISSLSTRRPLAGVAPPPVKPASLLGLIRAASGNPFETVPAAAYRQSTYRSRTLLGPLLMVNDPEGVRRVLLDNVANYPKNPLEIEFFSAMFGEGLLSAGDSKWRVHRKVMAPSFGVRNVAACAPVIAQTVAEHAAAWSRLAGLPTFDMAEDMKSLTLKIICRTMFSSDAEELTGLAGPALNFAQAALGFGLLDVLPVIGPRRMRQKQEDIRAQFGRMDAAIQRLIAQRESNLAEAPKDLLTRLIAAKDPDNGAGLDAAEVRDEVITIFMAGYETTAVTMTWVWYLLSQHPAQRARLQAELDTVLADRLPGADDLAQLPYARRVIEETMRLYPPAPGMSVREARAPDELCGVSIPARAQILVSPWVLHRHEQLWDEPLRFDPERFAPDRSAARSRFAYLPFGAGPRICIGASLAMTEAMLILAILARGFEATLVDGQDIRLQTRITLRPKNGLKMRIAVRAGH